MLVILVVAEGVGVSVVVVGVSVVVGVVVSVDVGGRRRCHRQIPVQCPYQWDDGAGAVDVGINGLSKLGLHPDKEGSCQCGAFYHRLSAPVETHHGSLYNPGHPRLVHPYRMAIHHYGD